MNGVGLNNEHLCFFTSSFQHFYFLSLILCLTLFILEMNNLIMSVSVCECLSVCDRESYLFPYHVLDYILSFISLILGTLH